MERALVLRSPLSFALAPLLLALAPLACSSESSPADGGAEPAADASAVHPDAGTPAPDAETTPSPDAGTPSPDAGTTPAPDAGSVAVRDAARVYFVGHSLVNHDMTGMFEQIARSLGRTHTHDLQIKNGTPLRVQWDDATPGEGRLGDGLEGRPNTGQLLPGVAKTALATGQFDVLVLAELVPVSGNIQWNCSPAYGLEFYNLATRANPNIQTYFYEVWRRRDDGDFRGLIAQERPIWEEYLVDAMNTPVVPVRIPPLQGGGRCSHPSPPATREPGKPVLVIPGGRAMSMLADAIEQGTVPGITTLDGVFRDQLHLNDLGNYFLAMVHYATIYGRSPMGATRATVSEWGNAYTVVPEPLANRFAELAWQAVLAEPRSGVH